MKNTIKNEKISEKIDDIYGKYGVECDVSYIDKIDSISKMGIIVDIEEVFEISIPTDLMNDHLIFNRELMIDLISGLLTNGFEKGKGWNKR